MQKTHPGVEIIWRAFELRPEPVPTLDPAGDYLKNAWASSVYPLAERLGVMMRLPPVQPRSRLAHEAAQWARSQGRFDDFHAAVFRAFFERGEDIGQAEVLTGLAAGLRMDADSLRSSLADGLFLERVLEDQFEARELGVGGVPAFVAGRKAALSGVQPLENLIKLIEFARR